MGPKNEGMMVLNNPLELGTTPRIPVQDYIFSRESYKSSFCHWNPGWGGRYVDPNNPSQRPPTASHPGTSHRKSHGPPYPRSAGTWQCRAHRRHRTTQSSLGVKIRLESIFRLESKRWCCVFWFAFVFGELCTILWIQNSSCRCKCRLKEQWWLVTIWSSRKYEQYTNGFRHTHW